MPKAIISSELDQSDCALAFLGAFFGSVEELTLQQGSRVSPVHQLKGQHLAHTRNASTVQDCRRS